LRSQVFGILNKELDGDKQIAKQQQSFTESKGRKYTPWEGDAVGLKQGGSRVVPGVQEPYTLIKVGICMFICGVRNIGRIWVVLRSRFR
jgi:hypothetical protein